MSNAVRDFFEEQVTLLSVGELVERIIEEARKLRKQQKAGSLEEDIKKAANDIKKSVIVCHHPIVRKLLDWGHLKGRNKHMHKLECTVCKLLKKECKGGYSISPEDVRELGEILANYKEWVIESVRKVVEGA